MLAAMAAVACATVRAGAAEAPSAAAAQATGETPLARSLAGVIAGAIPSVYEKQKDWGKTKNITVGLRNEGHGLKLRLHRRKKAVNHGVWKHYQIRVVDPADALVVQLTELRPAGPGKMAFALHLEAAIDAWGRVKIYEYGVHLGAYEVVADARLRLDVAGEIALRLDAGTAAAVVPEIRHAAIRFDDLQIRRVSNAHGPLVRELGDGVRHWLEDSYDEAKLVGKLNRAIEKKQDRLRVQWSDVATSDWFAAAAE